MDLTLAGESDNRGRYGMNSWEQGINDTTQEQGIDDTTQEQGIDDTTQEQEHYDGTTLWQRYVLDAILMWRRYDDSGIGTGVGIG